MFYGKVHVLDDGRIGGIHFDRNVADQACCAALSCQHYGFEA
jgi:hypothetical protein